MNEDRPAIGDGKGVPPESEEIGREEASEAPKVESEIHLATIEGITSGTMGTSKGDVAVIGVKFRSPLTKEIIEVAFPVEQGEEVAKVIRKAHKRWIRDGAKGTLREPIVAEETEESDGESA